jgi:light-regulated signal transduction histidine kinase (bacteriophytochrome)
MSVPTEHPPFGSADLSNCERELIHLAGSVQPYGALLVVREPDFAIVQASDNACELLGVPGPTLLGRSLDKLDSDLAPKIRTLAHSALLGMRAPLRCFITGSGGRKEFDVEIHRAGHAGIVIEIEPHDAPADRAEWNGAGLARTLTGMIADIGSAPTLDTLCDAVVTHFRTLAGYDRVMVYKFDQDGHGEVVAEARDTRYEPFLGLHYPASDIPQRARELYMRNRVRVLVDVHYAPVPIEPRTSPVTGTELDMSQCHLRSMSPLHLQYLQNMGVTATLVASLVRHGRLWGLVACHHYSPKVVPYDLRAACELLAEVVSTRISALENYAQAHAELLVRKLERRLIDATATTGDWRMALFSQSQTLLRAVEATGAALYHEGEVLTAGETPSVDEVRALCDWLAEHSAEPLFFCSSLARLNPDFAALSPVASGILAVTLSHTDHEYLVWFRREQPSSVTWAGNPNKPFVVGNSPRDLSPRRSFAAWSELVRDTGRPWTTSEVATASAIRSSLVDLVLQIRSVRVLIVERQAARVRAAVENAAEPVVIAGPDGNIVLANRAFHALFIRPKSHVTTLNDLPVVFAEPDRLRSVLSKLCEEGQPWRGELALASSVSKGAQLALRADPVPTATGEMLGFVLIFTDRSERREAEATRRRLETTAADGYRSPLGGVAAAAMDDLDHLVAAILGNASAAVLEITESTTDAPIATLLREVESAARRATDLGEQILSYAAKPGGSP